ncbi:hypothetical protein GCU69_08010, partial [Streptomyces lycii]
MSSDKPRQQQPRQQQQPQQQHPDGTPAGGWQPIAQGGEYDSDATAFVQLPESLLDPAAGPPGREPLAAPGHGYTPPPIAATDAADPSAPGPWTMPYADADQAGGAHWQSGPGSVSGHGAPSPGHWAGPDSGGAEGTGQGGDAPWTVPPAADDVPDESGEYLVGGAGPAAPGQWNFPSAPSRETGRPGPGTAPGEGWDGTGTGGHQQPQQWGYVPENGHAPAVPGGPAT